MKTEERSVPFSCFYKKVLSVVTKPPIAFSQQAIFHFVLSGEKKPSKMTTVTTIIIWSKY